jgi:ABC-type transporter Mla subunit MlaD
MSKKDIIKSIAPILDEIVSNRKELKKVADALDTIFDESTNKSDVDVDRINNLFAAVSCLKEAEEYISKC